MIEYALPLCATALACYVGARFALLAGWPVVTGALRLLALWCAAAWAGYGTPLYVALMCLPLGFFWSMFRRQLLLLVLFELLFAALLVWYAETPIVGIYLVALVVFDQLAARLLLVRYDRQREPNLQVNRLIVLAAPVSLLVLVWYYYGAPIAAYARSHTAPQVLSLQPEGAAPLWFYKRELSGAFAGDAQPGSVYWQARYPEASASCVVSFHGASAQGSLQSTARTLGRAAQRAGLRMFAIDHPGFGASPAPAVSAAVDAWDPAHLTTAVLAEMAVAGCEDTMVLGHSQGVTEALRVLTSNTPGVSSVLVLGAGLYEEGPEQENYWYERFHIDRKLADRMDRERWKLIRDLYYLNQEFCGDTVAGQSYRDVKPFHFVLFDREHANLVATREKLWNCLGYLQSDRHLLHTDHYLDSVHVGAMIFLQRSSARAVAELFPVKQDSLESDS